MSEYPEDIRAAAHACYLECEQMDTDGVVDTISKFLAAERNRCAEVADMHARQCASKLNKKRSDHDLAVFESAASEAMSISAFIRSPVAPSKAKQAEETR